MYLRIFLPALQLPDFQAYNTVQMGIEIDFCDINDVGNCMEDYYDFLSLQFPYCFSRFVGKQRISFRFIYRTLFIEVYSCFNEVKRRKF